MDGNYLLELAKGAYEAYGLITDHKNYQGLPMPEWDDLTETIKQAWINFSSYVFNRTIEDQFRAMKQEPDHR